MAQDIGGRAEREHKHLHISFLYVCAAFGGFLAAVADVIQKEEASAVIKITQVSAEHMDITLKPIWVLLGLVTCASFLCLVFQPGDRRAAFGVGLSVVAVVMTVTPYEEESSGAVPKISSSQDTEVKQTFLMVISSQPVSSDFSKDGDIIFHLINRGTSSAKTEVRVFNATSGKKFRQRKIALPGQTVSLRFRAITSPEDDIRYEIISNERVIDRSTVKEVRRRTYVSHDVSSSDLSQEGCPSGLFGDACNKLFRSFRW